jgi:hypothetical protein
MIMTTADTPSSFVNSTNPDGLDCSSTDRVKQNALEVIEKLSLMGFQSVELEYSAYMGAGYFSGIKFFPNREGVGREELISEQEQRYLISFANQILPMGWRGDYSLGTLRPGCRGVAVFNITTKECQLLHEWLEYRRIRDDAVKYKLED